MQSSQLVRFALVGLIGCSTDSRPAPTTSMADADTRESGATDSEPLDAAGEPRADSGRPGGRTDAAGDVLDGGLPDSGVDAAATAPDMGTPAARCDDVVFADPVEPTDAGDGSLRLTGHRWFPDFGTDLGLGYAASRLGDEIGVLFALRHEIPEHSAGYAVYFVRLDATGRPVGPTTRLQEEIPGVRPISLSLVSGPGEWAAGWRELGGCYSRGCRVVFRRIGPDGCARGPEVSVAEHWDLRGDQLQLVGLAYSTGDGYGALVSYLGDLRGDLSFQRLGADGLSLEPPVILARGNLNHTLRLVGLPDGNFVGSWGDGDFLFPEITSLQVVHPASSTVEPFVDFPTLDAADFGFDGTTLVASGFRSVYVAPSYRDQTVVLRGRSLEHTTVLAERTAPESAYPFPRFTSVDVREGEMVVLRARQLAFETDDYEIGILTGPVPTSAGEPFAARGTFRAIGPEIVVAASAPSVRFASRDRAVVLWVHGGVEETELRAMPIAVEPEP